MINKTKLVQQWKLAAKLQLSVKAFPSSSTKHQKPRLVQLGQWFVLEIVWQEQQILIVIRLGMIAIFIKIACYM